MKQALAGGVVGGVVAVSAVAVWFVAALWNWNFLFGGSPSPGPGQKFFMYAVAPGMLGAATVPVSRCLGAGRRRTAVVFAVVCGASAGVSVFAVESAFEVPWTLVAMGYFGVSAVTALVACEHDVRGEGRVALGGAMIAAAALFGMFAAFVLDSVGNPVVYVVVYVAPWVVFPVVAAAAAEKGIGGKG